MDAAAAALYAQGYAVASITLKTRQAALAAARRFFELPDAVKRKATAPKTTGDAWLLAFVFLGAGRTRNT